MKQRCSSNRFTDRSSESKITYEECPTRAARPSPARWADPCCGYAWIVNLIKPVDAHAPTLATRTLFTRPSVRSRDPFRSLHWRHFTKRVKRPEELQPLECHNYGGKAGNRATLCL